MAKIRITDQERAYLRGFGDRLLWVTVGCRGDMHEPDEQELSACVRGDHLDNAFGDDDTSDMGFQEFVVTLSRNGMPHRFNLATLIALARLGAERITR